MARLNLHTLNTSAILFVHPDASGTNRARLEKLRRAGAFLLPYGRFFCLCQTVSRNGALHREIVYGQSAGSRWLSGLAHPVLTRHPICVQADGGVGKTNGDHQHMCTATEPTSADDRHDLKLYLANIHKLLISDQEGARVEQNTAIATQLLELVIDRLEVAA